MRYLIGPFFAGSATVVYAQGSDRGIRGDISNIPRKTEASERRAAFRDPASWRPG